MGHVDGPTVPGTGQSAKMKHHHFYFSLESRLHRLDSHEASHACLLFWVSLPAVCTETCLTVVRGPPSSVGK